jgi:hypothetical protein
MASASEEPTYTAVQFPPQWWLLDHVQIPIDRETIYDERFWIKVGPTVHINTRDNGWILIDTKTRNVIRVTTGDGSVTHYDPATGAPL